MSHFPPPYPGVAATQFSLSSTHPYRPYNPNSSNQSGAPVSSSSAGNSHVHSHITPRAHQRKYDSEPTSGKKNFGVASTNPHITGAHGSIASIHGGSFQQHSNANSSPYFSQYHPKASSASNPTGPSNASVASSAHQSRSGSPLPPGCPTPGSSCASTMSMASLRSSPSTTTTTPLVRSSPSTPCCLTCSSLSGQLEGLHRQNTQLQYELLVWKANVSKEIEVLRGDMIALYKNQQLQQSGAQAIATTPSSAAANSANNTVNQQSSQSTGGTSTAASPSNTGNGDWRSLLSHPSQSALIAASQTSNPALLDLQKRFPWVTQSGSASNANNQPPSGTISIPSPPPLSASTSSPANIYSNNNNSPTHAPSINDIQQFLFSNPKLFNDLQALVHQQSGASNVPTISANPHSSIVTSPAPHSHHITPSHHQQHSNSHYASGHVSHHGGLGHVHTHAPHAHGHSMSVPNGTAPSTLTEDSLLLLAIRLLAENGPVPVGKMGSLLHRAAADHTLPALLKERYGGLKKFLQSFPQFFTLGEDHPYNPTLRLSHLVPLPAPIVPPHQSNNASLNAALPQQSALTTQSATATPLMQPMSQQSESALTGLPSKEDANVPDSALLGIGSGGDVDDDRNPFLFETDADIEKLSMYFSSSLDSNSVSSLVTGTAPLMGGSSLDSAASSPLPGNGSSGPALQDSPLLTSAEANASFFSRLLAEE